MLPRIPPLPQREPVRERARGDDDGMLVINGAAVVVCVMALIYFGVLVVVG